MRGSGLSKSLLRLSMNLRIHNLCRKRSNLLRVAHHSIVCPLSSFRLGDGSSNGGGNLILTLGDLPRGFFEEEEEVCALEDDEESR